MPAATLNLATNALHVSSVRRSPVPRATRSASEIARETAGSVRMTVLAGANDPVVALALEDRADPALETALVLDRIHAPIGETVQVAATGAIWAGGRQMSQCTSFAARTAPAFRSAKS